MKYQPWICDCMRSALMLVAFLVPVMTSQAATFTVTNTDDDGAGSLRQAIVDANADDTATPEDPHVIDATSVNGTIELSSASSTFTALPALSRHVRIQGPGALALSVENTSAGNVRILGISADATVEISGLTISNGVIVVGAGGGIYNAGTLTLRGVAITDCVADGGGGIFNMGELWMENSTIAGNRADFIEPHGGGLWNWGTGTAKLISTQVTHNTAGQKGGGIFNQGEMLVGEGSRISENTAEEGNVNGGGGIFNEGEMAIRSTTVDKNEASEGGGGAIRNASGAVLTIENSQILGNRTPGAAAGGIANSGEVTLLDSTVAENESFGAGGGIGSGGVLMIKRSAIRDNKADIAGGGIVLTSSGAATIMDSTISGNQADLEPGGISGGGAVHVSISSGAKVTLINSTVSGNTADGIGGLDLGPGDAVIENCTIAANSGINLGVSSGGTTSVRSTLLANPLGQSAVNCQIGGNNSAIASQGYNLADDASCNFNAPGDQPAANALLAPLADNDGPTQTHALGEGSPAINKGIANGLTTDQRGFARTFDFPGIPHAPGGDGTDIGAFELQPIPNDIFRDRFEK